MPLTPAHAAAAWPIARIAPRLPLAALVIGALSPDFEFFLHLAPRSTLSHSPLGLILFCLPASVAAWAIFETLIQPAILDLLPQAMRDAMASNRGKRSGRPPGVVAVAALAGAITHLGWDGFTHDGGWAVHRIPALGTEVTLPVLGSFPWYKVLQHGSTLAGSLVVCAWLARSWVRHPSDARRFTPDRRARTLRILAFLMLASLAAGVLNAVRAPHAGLAPMLGFGAVGAMVGLLLATSLFGAIVRARARRR